MMAAPRAILLQLDAIRGVPPVLPAVVVPALALLASQRYQLSHNLPPNHRDGDFAVPVHQRYLLHYLGDDACSYSPSTLPDGKVQPLVHRYGAYQLHIHYRVVPWHHHLYPFFQTDLSRHIRGPEVELGAVVRKERRVTTPLFLREHIYLCLEAGVRCYGVGLGQHLPTLYVITLYSP